jgi:hypothetical protein
MLGAALKLDSSRAKNQAEEFPCSENLKLKLMETVMKIKLCSIFVDDQDKALQFYTQVLGFIKKAAFPVGEAKWLTVVSPAEPNGTELLLEPKIQIYQV